MRGECGCPEDGLATKAGSSWPRSRGPAALTANRRWRGGCAGPAASGRAPPPQPLPPSVPSESQHAATAYSSSSDSVCRASRQRDVPAAPAAAAAGEGLTAPAAVGGEPVGAAPCAIEVKAGPSDEAEAEAEAGADAVCSGTERTIAACGVSV